MQTKSDDYADYLQNKYLPFRDQYLSWFYYPRLLKQFGARGKSTIVDLGCGLGCFLRYCQKKKIAAKGYDNNLKMVAQCQREGLRVEFASILELPDERFDLVYCDNVLEHLPLEAIEQFLTGLKPRMTAGGRLVMVVPGRAGYKTDPTHQTFVTFALMQTLCDKHGVKLLKTFYTPVNSEWIANFWYLNMQVCVLEF